MPSVLTAVWLGSRGHTGDSAPGSHVQRTWPWGRSETFSGETWGHVRTTSGELEGLSVEERFGRGILTEC